MAIPEFFKTSTHAEKQEIYGYGRLEVGESTAVDLSATNETATKIRGMIYSHANYHGKKFKTRTVDGILRIMRVA